jgi:hypothetical protein
MGENGWQIPRCPKFGRTGMDGLMLRRVLGLSGKEWLPDLHELRTLKFEFRAAFRKSRLQE